MCIPNSYLHLQKSVLSEHRLHILLHDCTIYLYTDASMLNLKSKQKQVKDFQMKKMVSCWNGLKSIRFVLWEVWNFKQWEYDIDMYQIWVIK